MTTPGSSGSLVSREWLEAFRSVGDEAADIPMGTFRPEITDVKDLVGSVSAAMRSPNGPAGDLGEWLVAPRAMPDWADPALILQGQQMFRRWGLQIGAVLFTASLPWAYAAEYGVQSLARASDLSGRDVRMRIAETGQMLVDVCGQVVTDTTFDPAGQAYLSIDGVRTLHAAVRRALQTSGTWNDEWGLPINQQDLAGTLLTFSTVVFDGLRELGVSLRPEEETAYLHLWAVVGHFLGLDHQLIRHAVDDAHRLQADIAGLQHRPCDEGRRLMRALLDELELSMPRGLRKVPRTFVRRLSGNDVADNLAVPPSAWWAPLLGLTAAIGRRVTRVPGVRALSGWPGRGVGAAMFRMYIDGGLKGRPARFRLDPALVKQWRLRTGRVRTGLRSLRLQPRLNDGERHPVAALTPFVRKDL